MVLTLVSAWSMTTLHRRKIQQRVIQWMIKEEEKDPNCKVVEIFVVWFLSSPLLFLLSIEFEVFAPKEVIVRSEGMKCPASVDNPVIVIRDLLGRLMADIWAIIAVGGTSI
jgi:hypothetical protein